MDELKSLPAKDLVERWMKTDDEFEEGRFGEEIKRRTDIEQDGKAFSEIKELHRRIWNVPPEKSPTKESEMSDFDYEKMKRIHRKTKKILGDEAVDVIRRFDMGTPRQLIERLVIERKRNSMRGEVKLRRAV